MLIRCVLFASSNSVADFIALYYVLQSVLKGSQFDLLYPFVHNPGSINKISLGLFDLEKRVGFRGVGRRSAILAE